MAVDAPLFPTLLVMDIDLDGHPDVFIGDHDRQTILFGDGSGLNWTVVTMALFSPTSYGTGQAGSFQFADVTGDGMTDLIVAMPSPFSCGLQIYVGAGRSFGPAVCIARTTSAREIQTADFNHDGRFDIVIGATPAHTGWPTPLPLTLERINIAGYGSW